MNKSNHCQECNCRACQDKHDVKWVGWLFCACMLALVIGAGMFIIGQITQDDSLATRGGVLAVLMTIFGGMVGSVLK